MKVQIAPSLLSADFARLEVSVREAEVAGADMLHFDVMDGHFVPNITFGPLVLEALRERTRIPFEAHLMIERPESYVEAFARAGADLITVHPEATVHLHRLIGQIREAGARPGVALNPATPLDAVQYVLPDLDLLLIMTVNPGFGGQEFIPEMVAKIQEARRMIDERGVPVLLAVDGGIHEGTAATVVRAGAELLVAGTAIFGHPQGVSEAVKRLRDAARAGLAPL